MAFVIKRNAIKFRGESGGYASTDVVAEATTAEKIAAINAAGDVSEQRIVAKGEQTLASIPDDYTDLSNTVTAEYEAYKAGGVVVFGEFIDGTYINASGEETQMAGKTADVRFIPAPVGNVLRLPNRTGLSQNVLIRAYDTDKSFLRTYSFRPDTESDVVLASDVAYIRCAGQIDDKPYLMRISALHREFVQKHEIAWLNSFLTVEQFGAVGDGVTDDTAAIKAAVQAASAQNIELRFDGSKCYASQTVTISSEVKIDFCNATLVGVVNAAVLKVSRSENRPNGYLRHLTIDCNYTSRGIFVEQDWRCNYEDITIKNVVDGGYGIRYDLGGGNFFRGIRGRYDDFTHSSHAGNATFLIINAPDSTFEDVDYQHYSYGLDISSMVRLNNIHGYITKGVEYNGSYFMRLKPWASAICTMLYPDTVESMFKFTEASSSGKGKQILVCNGLYTYFNGECDIAQGDYAQPYVFSFDGSNRASIKICGAYLNAYDAVAVGKKQLTLCNGSRDKIELLNYESTNVAVN